jgi:hypothetical protein
VRGAEIALLTGCLCVLAGMAIWNGAGPLWTLLVLAAGLIVVRAAWESRSSWEKLRRATSAPASMSRRRISSWSVAGPRVTTIFVLRNTGILRLRGNKHFMGWGASSLDRCVPSCSA